jgi:RNA polymerase sigma-70 factor (ECF subfamily)
MNSTDLFNTTTQLLDGLHESGNRAAWNEFDRRYRPVVVAFLRRAGLDEADVADVAQETLACFVQDFRQNKIDPERGRLCSWLIGIARCRLADLQRDVGRRRQFRDESAIVELCDEAEVQGQWEAEVRRNIFQQAVGELRRTTRFNERTIEAFERVVLRQEPIDAVSAQLGLTPQEIYNAKNRVVEKLRGLVKRYESRLIGA